MMMINHIAILIFLSSIVISASQKWTYKNKLGQTEYCCFCYYDFRTENTIQECLSKNKNDTRRPFCICNKGKLPKCPESTTICNRQIACPENLAYQICKVPFLDDAKLVCNDSLLWEAHFTCPECPENTTVCNRRITCPERQYYQECKVPFRNNGKLVCSDNLKWKPNFTCPGVVYWILKRRKSGQCL
ncbi:uncharacterized protein LOC106874402 [Octopus bimaculoides]|uniref:uncharacterized protein LOC106874402 n=1 Tax=Octopus bimaculoides TaxID=37653 RepID=UPI0022E81EF2|nr:uncharacterized protein LOC106874402 [Octopus bimaculoides]